MKNKLMGILLLFCAFLLASISVIKGFNIPITDFILVVPSVIIFWSLIILGITLITKK